MSMSTAGEKSPERRGFFTRAAAIFLPGNRGSRSGSDATQRTNASSTDGRKSDGLNEKENKSATDSTNTQNGDGGVNEALLEDKDRRRFARTLPPWIHSLEQSEVNDTFDPASTLLPQEPCSTRPAQHNYTPAPRLGVAKGRRFDHHRSNEAVTITQPVRQHASRWRIFAESSAYAQGSAEESHLVDDEWMRDNLSDLEQPWAPGLIAAAEEDPHLWLFSSSKRKATAIRYNRMLMKNAFVPLIIRLTVLAFVVAALGLGAYIYRDTTALNSNPDIRAGTVPGQDTAGNYICEQQPSTYMAFIVDSIAVVYLLYITWDEYASKPLGLRSFRAKMRLIFLDLLFIVFSAANLSLAFNTLTDKQWACYADAPSANLTNNEAAALTTCVQNSSICQRQQTLCAMLTLALAAWLMTFSISVLRVVDRLAR